MTDRDDHRPLQYLDGDIVRVDRQPVGVVHAERAIVRGGSVRLVQTDRLQTDASAIGVAQSERSGPGAHGRGGRGRA